MATFIDAQRLLALHSGIMLDGAQGTVWDYQELKSGQFCARQTPYLVYPLKYLLFWGIPNNPPLYYILQLQIC